MFKPGDVVEFIEDLLDYHIFKGEKARVVDIDEDFVYVNFSGETAQRRILCGKKIKNVNFLLERVKLSSSISRDKELALQNSPNQKLLTYFKPISHTCPICGALGTPGFNINYWCSNITCKNGG